MMTKQFEYTTEQLSKWLNEIKLKGISPDTLLIHKPDINIQPTITICGEKIRITAKPMICTVMGIEVWVDEKIPEGKAYLIDSKTIKELEL